MSFQPEDFPILCETCLGENPYLRMTRERFSKGCKICDRPFTVYRWRPGPRCRFKKTEICGTCAKLKNVCQTCILDLQYGLPVQVRDEALAQQDETAVLQTDLLPVSRPNRNYMYEQLEHQIGLGGENTSLQLPYQQLDVQNGGNAMLQRIQRRGPYYKRNLPHICSFFVKGTCNRGDACPYRHVHPSQDQKDDALKDQNIKDRFYGVNDPVANKLINKYEKWMHGGSDDDGNGQNEHNKNRPLPPPPADTTVRTLFVGGIDWSMNEDLIRDKFQSFGELTSVVLLQDRKCGFVTFATRELAEQTMTALFDKLFLNQRKCQLNWARPKNENQNSNSNPKEQTEKTNASNGVEHAPQEPVTTSTQQQNEKNEDPPEREAVDVTQLTDDDKTYLLRHHITAPALPPLPDASAVAQNIPYVAKRGTQYQSMTEHYNEAKVTTRTNGAVRHVIECLERKVQDLQDQLNCERCQLEIATEKNIILDLRLKENSNQYEDLETRYIHLQAQLQSQPLVLVTISKHDDNSVSAIRTENKQLKRRLEEAQQTISERNNQIHQLHQELINLKNKRIQTLDAKQKETDELQSRFADLEAQYRTLMKKEQSLRRCFEDRGPYLGTPRQAANIRRVRTATMSESQSHGLLLQMPSLLWESSSVTSDEEDYDNGYEFEVNWLAMLSDIEAIIDDPESADAVKHLKTVE